MAAHPIFGRRDGCHSAHSTRREGSKATPSVMPAFGQTTFGQKPHLAKKSEFGQFWCFNVLAKLCCCCCHCFCCCSWLLLLVVVCWCLVVVVVPGWCLLVPVGACWCLLVPVGACWCLLVPVGACWCLLVLVPVGGACWWLLFVCVLVCWGGGCVQDFWAPPPDRPSPGPPKFSLFFFSLPPEISFFLLSLRGLLVEFWWCLKRRDAQMCAFGVLWLSCGTPAVHLERARESPTRDRHHSGLTPSPGWVHNGAALVDARRRKERSYPELSGEGGRARLVVLAAEVGGRWDEGTECGVGMFCCPCLLAVLVGPSSSPWNWCRHPVSA